MKNPGPRAGAKSWRTTENSSILYGLLVERAPLYFLSHVLGGEGWGEGSAARISGPALFSSMRNRPSPQPSPRITGERESERARGNQTEGVLPELELRFGRLAIGVIAQRRRQIGEVEEEQVVPAAPVGGVDHH